MTINGVTIKNIKTFVGHEGYCSQGNVYIDGKKAGFWSQDSWGGCDDYEMDNKMYEEIKKRARKFAEGCVNPSPLMYDWEKEMMEMSDYVDFMSSPDIFMGKILNLKEDEKMYKKWKKEGKPSVYFGKSKRRTVSIGGSSKHDDVVRNNIIKDFAERLKREYNGEEFVTYHYASDKDFDIVCDAEHPVPVHLM